jgi:hypothetical protein
MAASAYAARPSDPLRRPSRDIIDAIVQSMRDNLEELKYSTLAPSRYLVYLHPAEYARLEGILPHLQMEAVRALTEAIERLNRRRPMRRYVDRLAGTQTPLVQNAGTAWQVDLIADPDRSLNEGDILVESELLLPAQPELGVGARTRRLSTRHTTRPPARHDREPGLAPALARLVYDDEDGHHSHDVTADSVTVGRGGSAYPVDVRIAASPDVSREHARIRRHPQTGEFFLIDLSSLGTTLNGRHVPRGYEQVDGSKRENGVETLLPDRARIGLAAAIHLDFEVIR